MPAGKGIFKDHDSQNETDLSMDSDYNIDEYKLDEQLVDTDEKNQNSEQVIQKKMLENLNMDYKVYTSEFDEITKAENLENADEENQNIAYTRYVLELGYSGDLLDLLSSLAPNHGDKYKSINL